MPNAVKRLPIVVALVYMMILDIVRKFRVAAIAPSCPERRRVPALLGGSLRTRHRELERAIQAAAEEAALLQANPVFLSRSQKVFHMLGISCINPSATRSPCWR